MGFCQIVFTAWLMLGLGVILAKNGEPRTGTYSIGVGLVSTVLQILLLWGGGFYG